MTGYNASGALVIFRSIVSFVHITSNLSFENGMSWIVIVDKTNLTQYLQILMDGTKTRMLSVIINAR